MVSSLTSTYSEKIMLKPEQIPVIPTGSTVYVRLLFSPGVYLDSEEPQPPSLRAEPSQPEEAELGFWLVRPGGGLEGAATDRALGGRGTFHSSWAREELDAEPPPGDHFDSLGLAARREEGKMKHFYIHIVLHPFY